MELKSLLIFNKDSYFFFERFTGSLLVKNGHIQSIHKPQTPKLAHAITLCNQPYLLKAQRGSHTSIPNSKLVQLYAKTLVWLCNLSFFLGRCFSLLGIPCFDTTNNAILAFRQCFPSAKQNDLCYSRSLFAASLSKSFKKNGVIFIGVFLPSTSMHAWIIEDGTQPDPYDNMWINFQPVAAIY